ncbi:MAG: MOSC domain-containing protein [Chloroflexota bacterium]|nr:MAG: MOSC domain-containing protein [Chloroflexota bacterium]
MNDDTSGHIFQIGFSDGGVPKLAVQQAEIDALGVKGDRHNHPEVHGGPKAALCVYALERIVSLQAEGHPVFPGALGENLIITGIDWSLVTPGARLRLGQEVLLEVTQYTSPCKTIMPYFTDGDYGRISQNLHPGWSRVYTRVLQPGVIRTGDRVTLEG